MTQLSSTFSYVKLLAILALAGYSTSAPTQSFAHDAQLVKRVDSGFSKDDAGGLQHDEQYNTVYVGSDWGVCSPLTKNGFDGLNLNTKTAITNAFSTVFNDFDFNAYSGKNIHFSTNGGDGTYSGIGLTLETANAHNAGNNFAYGDPVTQQLYGYNEWKDDGNFPPNVFKTLSCQSSAKNAAVMSSGNPDVKVTQQQVFGDSNVPGSITFSIQEGTSETTTWSYSSTSEQSLGVSNTLSYDVTIGNDASPVKESIGDSLTISYSQDSSTTTNNGHSNTMSSVRATTLGPYCQPSGSTCTALFNQTSFTSGGSITLHNSVHGYVWYEVACHDACDYMYDIVHQNLELLNPQGLPSCFKFYLWNNKGADQGEGSADGKGSQAGILLARGDIQCYADKGLFDPSTLLSTTTLQISTNGQSTATTGYHIVCDGGDISSCGGSALTNITIVNSGGSSSGTSGNSGTSAGGGSTPASGSSSGSSSASSGPSSGSTSGSSSGSSGSTSGPSTNSVLQCPQQLKTLTNSCNITLPDFTSLVSRQNSDTAGTIFQVEQAGTSGSLGTNLIHFTAASGTRSCQAVYQVTPPWSSYFLPEENTLVAPYDGSNMISSYTFGYEASCPQQYGSCYLESVVSANNPHMTWQPLTDASKSNIKLTFGNAGQAWQSDIFTFTLSCADGYGNIGHSQIQQYVQLQPVVGVTQAGATATVTQHTISVAQFTSIATYYQDVIVPSVVVAKYTTTYYSSTSYTDTTYLTVASALASTKTSAQTTTVTDPGSTIKATVQGSPVTRTVTCTITPAAATITATLTRGSTSTSTVFMAGPTQTVTQQCAKKAPTKHCILGYCWYMKRALRLDGQITARALPTLTKTTVAPSITTTVTDTSDTATFTQSGVTVTSIDLVSRFTAAYTTTVTNTVQTATYVGVLSTQATIIVKSYAVTATSTVLAHVAGSIVQTTITVAPVTTVKTVSSTGLNLTPITKTTTVAPAVIVITKTSPPTTITTCA